MNVQVPVRAATARSARLRPAFLTLAGCAVLWLLLFHAEAMAAVRIWASSTAYGHCFLVLPVAAWLAWERRRLLDGSAPRPWGAAALVALPLGAVWFLAERLGVMEGRQLAAVALLLVLVLGVLGPALWRAFAVPLLYLFFLVPFGGFLVGPLQVFTAHFIDVGLDVLGIAHVVTRFLIEIPEGTFRVAEACAGLRFLIAAIAFGVVYACTIYRDSGRRIAFIAASVVVPVIANGFRALGIVVLGHLLGSAQAGAVDHVLYGWIFFSIVILLLILAGLPFRQDATAYAPVAGAGVGPPARASAGLPLAAGGVLLIAAAAPAMAVMLDAAAAWQQRALPPQAEAAALAGLTTPAGCARLAAGRFDCGGVPIAVAVELFAPRSSPATLIAARRAVTPALDPETTASVSTWTLRRGRPALWEVTDSGMQAPLVATSLLIGGIPQRIGLGMRLHQAWASIAGSAARPALVTVTEAESRLSPATAAALLRDFLEQQTILPAITLK